MAQDGKVTGVKCQFQSEMGTIDTVWDFYVGPVHHDVILGMLWVTQWKARMRPLQATIEVCAPGDEERVHLSIFPTKLTSSKVSGVEPVPPLQQGSRRHHKESNKSFPCVCLGCIYWPKVYPQLRIHHST